MANQITISTTEKLFGTQSMEITTDSAMASLLTDPDKTNFVNVTGLSAVTVSCYLYIKTYTAGYIVARTLFYDVNGNLLGNHDWVLQSAINAGFTRFYQTYRLDQSPVPTGTVKLKLQFGGIQKSSANPNFDLFIDGVKAEQGDKLTAFSDYTLKENDSLDLVGDGVVFKKVAGVNTDHRITSDSIESAAVTTTKLADSAVDATKLANGAVDNTKLADNAVTSIKIQDGTITNAKVAESTLTEDRLNSGMVTKLSKLKSDGDFQGDLFASDGTTKLIDSASGKVTTALQTSSGASIDDRIEQFYTDIYNKDIAIPLLDKDVTKSAVHPTYLTYRPGFTTGDINIGNIGDSWDSMFDLTRADNGEDLLDASGNPIKVVALWQKQNKTNAITAGSDPHGSGPGWSRNDGDGSNNSTWIELSVIPVVNFTIAYSVRKKLSQLATRDLVTVGVIKGGQSDANVTTALQELKGTPNWNDAVPSGRKLIELTTTKDGGITYVIADGKVKGTSIASNEVGNTHLVDNAVTTQKIDANAVTGNKIASGAVGNTQIANAAINDTKLADGAVTAIKVANQAIDASKLASSAVTTVKIAPNAVDGSKLASDSVDTTHLVNNAVDASKLASNSVTAGKIANSAVGTANLADGAVIDTKISDGAITTNKLNATALAAFDAHNLVQNPSFESGAWV